MGAENKYIQAFEQQKLEQIEQIDEQIADATPSTLGALGLRLRGKMGRRILRQMEGDRKKLEQQRLDIIKEK